MSFVSDDENECSDPESFVFGTSCSNPDFCEFNGWEKRIERFNNSLKQLCENSIDSFYNAGIWGAYFKLVGKTADFDGDLQQCLGTCFINKLYDLKMELKLNINLDTFEKKYHLINDMLFEKNMFLRLYELKKKFRYLFKKGHEKNEVQKEISLTVFQ